MSISNTTSQNNPSKETWIDLLHQRGISSEAAEYSQIRPNGQGWLYPIGPEVEEQRWKAFPGQSGPKYLWKPAQPEAARFYDPRGELAQHIHAADGVLWLAAGEPDVWSLFTAGIFNATCTLSGENTIPDWLIPELHRLDVHTVRYYPDRDQTGLRAAAKLAATFAGSGITLDVRELPESVGEKGDINTLLIGVGAKQLVAALEACPKMQPPALENQTQPAPRRDIDTTIPAEYHTLYERWSVEVVERAAIDAWDIAPPKNNGWSRRNFSSPYRADRNPSACWSYTAHGFQDFATGDFTSTAQVAALLGCQTWEDYKAQHAPAKVTAKARRKKDIQNTIEPVTLDTLDSHHTHAMRYISDLPVEEVMQSAPVLIKSPLGTGKTELVKHAIAYLDQQNDAPAKVLFVTHRQALAEHTAERLGLENYKTIPDSFLSFANRLVISLNSLHKVGDVGRFDLVVIDELEQFSKHLFSSTFAGGEAYRAHNTLANILSRTQHVIGLDAHLTNISALWMHRASGKAPVVIENTYTHQWGDLTVHKHESTVIGHAINAAQAGHGPVVIPTSSRTKSDIIYRMVCDAIGEEGVMLINGDNSTSAAAQHFIRNINSELPKLRVLITSPSLGTGLDVTAPVYGVYAVMLNRPIVATDMIQMLGRYRNAAHRHIYVQHLHQAEPRSALARWEDAIESTYETRHAADFAAYGIGKTTAAHHDILYLHTQLQYANDQQRTDLLSYFVAYAESEGFTLRYCNALDTATRDQLRATRDLLAEERKQRILTADPVSYEAYKQHEMAGTISPDIIAGHERWKIENAVGLTIDSKIYDDLHTSPARRALRRLADILADVDDLKFRDRQEAADNVLLVKRGHYTTTRDLIFEGIATVLGSTAVHSTAELTAEDITTRFKPWLAENLERVQRLVDRRGDLSSDPMFVFRRLLSAIGLKLSRRQVMRDGKRFMLYALDDAQRETWLTYAHARLAHLAAQDAITTNTEDTMLPRVCSNPLDLPLFRIHNSGNSAPGGAETPPKRAARRRQVI